MADDNRSKGAAGGPASAPEIDKEKQTGDPGRTPGKAEGDEETVDASLEDKERPQH
ncbi:MAG TPA: hypothetical protein VJT74_01015 [Pyrinomonadaceae bacterium]|jgi:hypothetical protein|nr:hypothetical protein [Pyrinomonadaceae bacterium]